MGADELLKNPYAASVHVEPVGESIAWHRDFELLGKRIRCRSGLWLPEICLVTGEKRSLVQMPISIYALRRSRRWLRRIGVALMVGGPLSVLPLTQISPVTPAGGQLTTQVWLLLIALTGFLLLGLAFFLAGGRRGVICRMQGSLQPRRLVLIRRLSFAAAPVLLLVVHQLLTKGSLVCIPLMALFSPLLWLRRGLWLRAIVDDDGLFEVAGFSKSFLMELGEMQKSEKQK